MGVRRRDIATALALLAAIVGVLLFADDSASGSGEATAAMPPGWHQLRRPIDGVLYPTQVLAAASFPAAVPRHPRGCHPGGVLGQMPRDAVLLQVIEYAPYDEAGHRLRVPHLPPRPARFHFREATFAPFECAGLSHQFTFEQEGRAFQAQVWFDPTTVDPLLRAQALRILDSFRPTAAATASGR
jgi:hypothetical protein